MDAFDLRQPIGVVLKDAADAAALRDRVADSEAQLAESQASEAHLITKLCAERQGRINAEENWSASKTVLRSIM